MNHFNAASMKLCCLFCAMLMMVGCATWEKGWEKKLPGTAVGDTKGLIDQANRQISSADAKAKVEALIRTYEAVLKIDPDNYEALWGLGRYYLLLGIAYSRDIEVKKANFVKSAQSCERAMYTDARFKKRIDQGKDVWSACEVLGRKGIEALYYWYSATGFMWKDCFSAIEKVIHLHWPARLKTVLDRMMVIDPQWGGGHPYFGLATYYSVVPSLFGGDMDKASAYFEKAEQAGPNWLYIKWGKAKIYHVKRKDRESFIKDLQWVIDQDPAKADSPYPWNIYFQRDANEMIRHADLYFE